MSVNTWRPAKKVFQFWKFSLSFINQNNSCDISSSIDFGMLNTNILTFLKSVQRFSRNRDSNFTKNGVFFLHSRKFLKIMLDFLFLHHNTRQNNISFEYDNVYIAQGVSQKYTCKYLEKIEVSHRKIGIF